MESSQTRSGTTPVGWGREGRGGWNAGRSLAPGLKLSLARPFHLRLHGAGPLLPALGMPRAITDDPGDRSEQGRQRGSRGVAGGAGGWWAEVEQGSVGAGEQGATGQRAVAIILCPPSVCQGLMDRSPQQGPCQQSDLETAAVTAWLPEAAPNRHMLASPRAAAHVSWLLAKASACLSSHTRYSLRGPAGASHGAGLPGGHPLHVSHLQCLYTAIGSRTFRFDTLPAAQPLGRAIAPPLQGPLGRPWAW